MWVAGPFVSEPETSSSRASEGRSESEQTQRLRGERARRPTFLHGVREAHGVSGADGACPLGNSSQSSLDYDRSIPDARRLRNDGRRSSTHGFQHRDDQRFAGPSDLKASMTRSPGHRVIDDRLAGSRGAKTLRAPASTDRGSPSGPGRPAPGSSFADESTLGIPALALAHRVEDAEVGRGVATGGGGPLPAAVVVGEVAVDQAGA